MYVQGNLFDIHRSEYGVYDYNDPYLSGKTYFVYRDIETDTPYTWINGKKIYATLYFNIVTDASETASTYANKPVFYFLFFKNENRMKRAECLCNTFNIYDFQLFPRWSKDIREEDTKEYINFDSFSYVIESGDTIPTLNNGDEEILVYRIDGIFADRFGTNYYCSGSTIYIAEETSLKRCDTSGYTDGCVRIDITDLDYLKQTDSYFYCIETGITTPNSDGEWAIIYKDIKKVIQYDAKILTGRTVSKIYDLRSYNLLVDDVGRQLEGVYNVRPDRNVKKYSQPPQYSLIEPIYQVGNTANIKRFSMTVQDEDKIVSGTNYFVGDIITSMEFYYADENGEAVTKKYGLSGSSLEKICEATKEKEEIESSIDNRKTMMDDIKCDITYYIGATLHRKKNEPYELDDDLNHGVKYTETVSFVKTEDKYYLRMPKKEVLPIDSLKPLNNDIYIPIYTYKLTQDKELVTSTLYETSYEVAFANFEAIININDEYNQWEDMANRNNMEIFPVFREDYRLGISAIEKVDSDIYIDRGINAAFEKHLKLGEVTSLEALEQYGVNFFKLMDS